MQTTLEHSINQVNYLQYLFVVFNFLLILYGLCVLYINYIVLAYHYCRCSNNNYTISIFTKSTASSAIRCSNNNYTVNIFTKSTASSVVKCSNNNYVVNIFTKSTASSGSIKQRQRSIPSRIEHVTVPMKRILK